MFSRTALWRGVSPYTLSCRLRLAAGLSNSSLSTRPETTNQAVVLSIKYQIVQLNSLKMPCSSQPHYMIRNVKQLTQIIIYDYLLYIEWHGSAMARVSKLSVKLAHLRPFCLACCLCLIASALLGSHVTSQMPAWLSDCLSSWLFACRTVCHPVKPAVFLSDCLAVCQAGCLPV